MFSSSLKRRPSPTAKHDLAGVASAPELYPYPYQITATPLYPTAPSRRRPSYLGRLLPVKMKAFFHKLRPGKSKEVKSLEQYPGGAVASRPIRGDTGDDAPSVDLRVISPGTWYGRTAALVLLQVNHHGTSAIPQAKVEVHLTTHEQGDSVPVVVGAGPFKVIAEQQPKEQSKDARGHADVGGDAGFAHVGAGLEMGKATKQNDIARGVFSAKPAFLSPAGAQGVRFSIRPPPGSQHGIPPCVHLAFVYAFEGAVEFEASLDIKGTPRKITLDRGKQDRIVWPRGQWLSYQNVKCSMCEKEKKDQCREFTHADREFWFNFLNQLNPEDPNCPSFVPNGSESWFDEFKTQAGVGAQSTGPGAW